jgi:hypothetical protein
LAKHQQVYKKTLTGVTLGTEILGQSSGGRSSGPCLALVFNVRQWYYELQQHYNKSRAKEMQFTQSPLASLSSSSASSLSLSSRSVDHDRTNTNTNSDRTTKGGGEFSGPSGGVHERVSHAQQLHGHLNMSAALREAGQDPDEEYVIQINSFFSPPDIASDYLISISFSRSSMNETTSLPSFKAFSCLIPWHFDEELDLIVRLELLLRPPSPAITFGLIGYVN